MDDKELSQTRNPFLPRTCLISKSDYVFWVRNSGDNPTEICALTENQPRISEIGLVLENSSLNGDCTMTLRAVSYIKTKVFSGRGEKKFHSSGRKGLTSSLKFLKAATLSSTLS